jgi:hypothetical protein
MEPHGQSPWYFHVLPRNPPKHTLLRPRRRRVFYPQSSTATYRGLLRRRTKRHFCEKRGPLGVAVGSRSVSVGDRDILEGGPELLDFSAEVI